MENKVVVIGLGLIGGSLALEFKRHFNSTIIGLDSSQKNAKKALEIGVIDKIGDFSMVKTADIVVLLVRQRYALSDKCVCSFVG